MQELKEKENLIKSIWIFPPFICFSVISLVDSNRKSVTHAVDLSNPHQPVAQTDEAEDGSMLQTGPRKTIENIITPQDRSHAAPPQSPTQQEASASQGKVVFVFEELYSHLQGI